MAMQQNDTKTGTHTFSAAELNHRDVSTIRRSLGVHELVVVRALSDANLLGKLLQASNNAVADALEKASKAN